LKLISYLIFKLAFSFITFSHFYSFFFLSSSLSFSFSLHLPTIFLHFADWKTGFLCRVSLSFSYFSSTVFTFFGCYYCCCCCCLLLIIFIFTYHGRLYILIILYIVTWWCWWDICVHGRTYKYEICMQCFIFTRVDVSKVAKFVKLLLFFFLRVRINIFFSLVCL